MTTFYRAQLETRHFSFEAFGRTESEAKAVMLRAMKKHAKATGINAADMISDYLDSINIMPFGIGCAYRDGGQIGKDKAFRYDERDPAMDV